MSKKVNIRKLASQNPDVDEKLVRDAYRMLKELREAGFPDEGYNLVPPYSLEPLRRQGSPQTEDDPRAVHLRI